MSWRTTAYTCSAGVKCIFTRAESQEKMFYLGVQSSVSQQANSGGNSSGQQSPFDLVQGRCSLPHSIYTGRGLFTKKSGRVTLSNVFCVCVHVRALSRSLARSLSQKPGFDSPVISRTLYRSKVTAIEKANMIKLRHIRKSFASPIFS